MNKVSIILPNYNYARFLKQRIESILNQTYKKFEIIILDDASTDNSWKIIQQFRKEDSRIRAYRNKENSGNPFSQWQKGISLATCELLWIAEADDHADPDFLSSMIGHLQPEEVGLAFSRSLIIDSEGTGKELWDIRSSEADQTFLEKSRIMDGGELIGKALIYENILANSSSVLFKKETYDRTGGVNPSLQSNADWHLWFRMALHKRIAFDNRPLNYFRRHSESVIHRSGKDSTNYNEQFDLTLRCLLRKEILKLTGVATMDVKRINAEYISYDLGNRALWRIGRGKIFQAIPDLFRATFYPRPTLGYIRRLFKSNIVKTVIQP